MAGLGKEQQGGQDRSMQEIWGLQQGQEVRPVAWTSRVGGCQGQWPGTRPKAQKGFEKQVATAWPLWSKKLFIAAMGGKPGWATASVTCHMPCHLPAISCLRFLIHSCKNWQLPKQWMVRKDGKEAIPREKKEWLGKKPDSRA